MGRFSVVLCLKSSFEPLIRTASGDDGTYQFVGIAPGDNNYVVIASDHSTPAVNAAISDQVTVEPMP